MSRKLRRKLDIVWKNGNAAARYIAKASPGRPPGSYAWDVFDRARDRFLTPREVLSLSDADLAAQLSN